MTMVKKSAVLVVIGLLLAAAAPGASEARVVRFVVEQTRTFAGGMNFGTVGTYQRLDGTAYMEVDPHDPLNAAIVNIDRAPRNVRGMVEFTAPFFILKPVDMTRGNHKIFYGINNPGNKGHLGRMTTFPAGPTTNNPLTADDINDDNLLTRLGYTYVYAGWQGNVAPGNDRLVPKLPIATQADGRPI